MVAKKAMPIQNVGTLLENIVLLEAARVLASRTTDRLALVNAFAMPPLSSWRDGAKYEYQVGFTDQVLERVVLLPAGAPTSYSALLSVAYSTIGRRAPVARCLWGC